MKKKFHSPLYAALVLLALSACSSVQKPNDSLSDSLSVNPYTAEEEMNFVERIIAQAPARLGAELVMDIYRGLSREGQELLLNQGREYLAAKKPITPAQIADRLANESEASQFLKSFRSAHPSYVDRAASAKINQALARESAGLDKIHSRSTNSSGMEITNSEMKQVVLALAPLSKEVKAGVVHAHNNGVNIADIKTCVTSEKLSPAALKNEGTLFSEMSVASDHLPVQSKQCLKQVMAATAARFAALTLGSLVPYETVAQLQSRCHIPSNAAFDAATLAGIQKKFPDAKKIPSDNAGVCSVGL